MKKLKGNILATAALLLMSTTLMAGEGTRGGGESINVAGRRGLRDLVDQAVCRWVSGPRFIAQFLPNYGAFKTRVDQAHWYLGNALQREADKMEICLTRGRLKRISEEDRDGVTIFEQQSEQIAIRFLDNHSVWVDELALQELSQEHKLFLFVHEVSHSFLPLDVPRRAGSLLSFIATLREQFDGEALAMAIRANHFDLPPTTQPLERLKPQLLLALDENSALGARIEAAKNLSQALPSLWSGDRKTIETGLARKLAEGRLALARAIESGDVKGIRPMYVSLGLGVNEFIDPFHGVRHRGGGNYAAESGLQIAVRAGQLAVLEEMLTWRDIDAPHLEAGLTKALRSYHHSENKALRRQMLDRLSRHPLAYGVIVGRVPSHVVVTLTSGHDIGGDDVKDLSRLFCVNLRLSSYRCSMWVYGGNSLIPLRFISVPKQ